MTKKILKRIFTFTLTFLFLLSSISFSQEKAPKYVFYFIGDGLGLSQRAIAQLFVRIKKGDSNCKLTMNTFPVVGIKTTHSADSLVTDSAAAGTALATGYKTNNGVIGKLPDGTDVKSILEAAEEKGYATGLISDTRLTHATLASFVSHNWDRHNENEIAVDFLNSNVEFLGAGGYGHFVPENWKYGESDRKDNWNILKEFHRKGYRVFATEKETNNFLKHKPVGKEKVIALLVDSHLPYELDRGNNLNTPNLEQLTQKGIDALCKYEKGFFMVVEGGRIDHACHYNDVVGTIHEVLAFDHAIKKAYEFYKKHPKETLIVVTADHETGGLGLGTGVGYFMKLEELKDVKRSIDHLVTGNKKYAGDRLAYLNFLEEVYGLDNLTKREMEKLEKAMELEDKNIEGDKDEYGHLFKSPVALATAHIISERANIHWTTFVHTGVPVPLTAIGVGAEKFGGYNDNTTIPKNMAEIMKVNLGH
ncbi:alkaline phosphatase [Anaeromicrobium sediminis]|uniref:Alkaline phosphatase n=1 Tax=Anaeromicrobium sediminis TaxID=1478221 RepID=A0A267MMA1_9FIRM|nr:alkaline phosphatase [Anaeromicrobium sediminis]PAB60731.1 alkaline phosphatase [Anaeromicrobium sediminis]